MLKIPIIILCQIDLPLKSFDYAQFYIFMLMIFIIILHLQANYVATKHF